MWYQTDAYGNPGRCHEAVSCNDRADALATECRLLYALYDDKAWRLFNDEKGLRYAVMVLEVNPKNLICDIEKEWRRPISVGITKLCPVLIVPLHLRPKVSSYISYTSERRKDA